MFANAKQEEKQRNDVTLTSREYCLKASIPCLDANARGKVEGRFLYLKLKPS